MKTLVCLFLLLLSFGARADFDLGDNYLGKTIGCPWGTFNTSGSSATPATAGTVYVSKDGDVSTQKAVVADLSGTDARASGGAGKHREQFATTNAYFTAGSEYEVYVAGTIVDGQTINRTICTFGLEARNLRGYVKTRGVASADDSSPNKVCFNSNIIASDDDFVGMTLWNFTTNEKYVITDSVASTDCVTVLPNVHTTESAGNTLLVLNDTPQFPLDLTAATGLLASGTCSAGSSNLVCIDTARTEANRYWINWAEIQIGSQPSRCIRGFINSTHTLSWTASQPLSSTAASQPYYIRASTACRTTG